MKTYAVFIKTSDSMSLVEYDSENEEFPEDVELISIRPLKEGYEDLNVGDLVRLDLERVEGNVRNQLTQITNIDKTLEKLSYGLSGL